MQTTAERLPLVDAELISSDRTDTVTGNVHHSTQRGSAQQALDDFSRSHTPNADSSILSQVDTDLSAPDIAPEIVVWPDGMSDEEESSESDSHGLSITNINADDELDEEEDSTMLQATNAGAEVPESFASSLSALTEMSDVSSIASVSSKATTPVETERRYQPNDYPSQAFTKPFTEPLGVHEIERLNFNVHPKSSVPNDMSSYQYASECLQAAEACRLNPYALHVEEYHLLRYHITHTQVTTYLNIRNGILRLWLKQPWVGITKQEAVGCASARWFDAASVCYDWLVRRGYINYGCVKTPQPAKLPRGAPLSRKKRTIAVIGAGISGLACARQLEGLFEQHANHFYGQGEEPPRVIVLEGRSRVGGRVYSREFKTKPVDPKPHFAGKRCTAEMGGMIITGFDRGNPMNVIVRGQLGLPYHTLTPETTIYDSNGKPVDPERDQLVEQLYNDCLDRVSEFKYKPQPSKVIEGDRDLLDAGRDSPRDGSRSIMQAEEATASLPHAPPVSQQNVPEKVNMIPISSDKLTGRVHTEPGSATKLQASEKARLMGWTLKSEAVNDNALDLDSAAELESTTLGSLLDHAISQYKGLVNLTALDHRLLNWHIANLEYSNATNLHNLSLGLWDIDAGNEWEGEHTMVVGGYQSVARGLLHCPSPLDLQTKFAVSKIRYSDVGLTGTASIESDDESILEADAIVCTIPLGVLKQGDIAFDPPLPAWKTDVVERLGFGILNKVVLVYDKIFWESHRHIFGVLREAPSCDSTSQSDYGLNRGRFFQWFNVTNTTGLPCLIALMAGDAGFETEHSNNESLISEATDILRSVFGKDVPYPVESVVTRWGSDQFARGSYSSAAPGMLPDDYDTMARSIGNLFFAGEHTIGTHPATVHGAYLSGLRAASEVLEDLIGPIEVPTPLILPRDSVLLQKRKETIRDPRQARKEAYELNVWGFIRSKLGERPVPPTKVAGGPYLLFSKVNFELAKKKCEETRKSGKTRSLPNEVRMMTSKMWKEASAEDRRPFEEQVAEQKEAYATALQAYNEAAEKWDQEAIILRAAYVKEHPCEDEEAGHKVDHSPYKHRRGRNLSYAEGTNSGMEL